LKKSGFPLIFLTLSIPATVHHPRMCHSTPEAVRAMTLFQRKAARRLAFSGVLLVTCDVLVGRHAASRVRSRRTAGRKLWQVAAKWVVGGLGRSARCGCGSARGTRAPAVPCHRCRPRPAAVFGLVIWRRAGRRSKCHGPAWPAPPMRGLVESMPAMPGRIRCPEGFGSPAGSPARTILQGQ
jgi:hypothetical protein